MLINTLSRGKASCADAVPHSPVTQSSRRFTTDRHITLPIPHTITQSTPPAAGCINSLPKRRKSHTHTQVSTSTQPSAHATLLRKTQHNYVVEIGKVCMPRYAHTHTIQCMHPATRRWSQCQCARGRHRLPIRAPLWRLREDRM